MTGNEEEKEYQQMVIPGTKEDDEEIMLMNDNSKRRKFLEQCNLKAKTICNPIIEWDEHEIWDFLQSEKIQTNPLYKMGFSREGCIGCPMAGRSRYLEFKIFPTYKRAYIRAFDKMLEAMKADGTGRIPRWRNGMDVFSWWMNEQTIEGQVRLDNFLELN